MADDNAEGQEVDLLIQNLSSARPGTPPQPKVAATAPVEVPRSTTRAIAPPARSGSRTFVSAISVQPPADEGGIKERAIDWTREYITEPISERIALPSFRSLPFLPSLPSLTNRTTPVWVCVGLGVALSTAMPFWPYPKACTWWLFLYLLAVAMVVVAGVWAARITWVKRVGVAHLVALGVVFWGITLAADETLPRIGYAKTEAVWFCR
jgi:hypothetical protein